jgi:hypothetical protein
MFARVKAKGKKLTPRSFFSSLSSYVTLSCSWRFFGVDRLKTEGYQYAKARDIRLPAFRTVLIEWFLAGGKQGMINLHPIRMKTSYFVCEWCLKQS